MDNWWIHSLVSCLQSSQTWQISWWEFTHSILTLWGSWSHHTVFIHRKPQGNLPSGTWVTWTMAQHFQHSFLCDRVWQWWLLTKQMEQKLTWIGKANWIVPQHSTNDKFDYKSDWSVPAWSRSNQALHHCCQIWGSPKFSIQNTTSRKKAVHFDQGSTNQNLPAFLDCTF